MPRVTRFPHRSRLAFVAVVSVALIAGTASVASAFLTSEPGPFTGCLGVKTNKGLVYNTALGSEPLSPCSRGDLQIQFSNAAGPQGEPGPTGPIGPEGPEGDPADVSELTTALEALEARIAALEGANEDDDVDDDGFTVAGGDCDDTNAAVNPEAPELANGLDDNCDSEVGTFVAYSGPASTLGVGICVAGIQAETAGGLGPIVGQVLPVPEILDNGLDDDCDGTVDEGSAGLDSDQDGYAVDGGDCDDTNVLVYPGAPEIVNGIDDDCDGALGIFPAGGSDVGECEAGTQAETPEGELGPIVGQVLPTVEIENERDDDCDGVVDDGV